MRKAKGSLEEALEAGYLSEIHEKHLELLQRHLPYTKPQVESLMERSYVLSAGRHPNSDDDGWERVRRRRTQKLKHKDLVDRWLHVTNYTSKSLGTHSPTTQEVGVNDDIAEVNQDREGSRGIAYNILCMRGNSTRSFNEHDEFLFSDDDEDGGMTRAKGRLRQRPFSASQLRCVEDVWSLSIRNRITLEKLWLEDLKTEALKNIEQARREYFAASQKVHDYELERDAKILRTAKVVGMTTTGAAKYRKLLEQVGPIVLIVEEAAEVLEAHVLSALVPSIEHIILIGDHMQLRPKIENYQLRINKLDVSMFERLLGLGLPHIILNTQYRMRPEFSSLLVPNIYKSLEDHSTVKSYPHIKGMSTNLFLLSHNEPESSDAKKSKLNKYEADMCVELSSYLLQNGYEATDIVILCAYAGQLILILDKIKQKLESVRRSVYNNGGGGERTLLGCGSIDRNDGLNEANCANGSHNATRIVFGGLGCVRVKTIDDFQGEESKIVILSLVRSNSERREGFLSESNRVCVALSRAKEGFYIIANGALLRTVNDLWCNILSQLEYTKSIGDAFCMRCERHRDNVTNIQNPGDFRFVAEGGCHLPCEERLDCGHSCPLLCHHDGHLGLRCKKPCTRKCATDYQHPCSKYCYEDCGPCAVKVPKTIAACGHTNNMSCYQNPDDASYICDQKCSRRPYPCLHPCQAKCGMKCPELCTVIVEKTYPSCSFSHKVNVECHMDLSTSPCTFPCESINDCGHRCRGTCGTCINGHSICKERCERIMFCGHLCMAEHPCSEGCQLCEKPCENKCIHSKCSPRLCSEICTPCQESCQGGCIHSKCSNKCGEMCNNDVCNLSCKKILRCGHSCIGLCGEICPTLCRICDADNEAGFDSLTRISTLRENDSNSRFIQLQDCGHIFDVEYLDMYMESIDIHVPSNDNIPKAIQPPTCPNCKKMISIAPSRYANIIKKCRFTIEELKSEHFIPAMRQKISRLLANPTATADDFRIVFEELVRFYRNRKKSPTIHNLIAESIRLFLLLAKNENLLDHIPEEFTSPKEHLEIALNLIGLDTSGNAISTGKTCVPRLSTLQENTEAYYSFLCLGMLFNGQEGGTAVAMAKLNIADHYARKAKLPLNSIEAVKEAVEKRLCVMAMEEVTKVERGKWFLCPNGHRYMIGECGAAMERSRCPDCGSAVGGGSHLLLEDNRRDRDNEFDGGGDTPYERAMRMEPTPDLIFQAQYRID